MMPVKGAVPRACHPVGNHRLSEIRREAGETGEAEKKGRLGGPRPEMVGYWVSPFNTAKEKK